MSYLLRSVLYGGGRFAASGLGVDCSDFRFDRLKRTGKRASVTLIGQITIFSVNSTSAITLSCERFYGCLRRFENIPRAAPHKWPVTPSGVESPARPCFRGL